VKAVEPAQEGALLGAEHGDVDHVDAPHRLAGRGAIDREPAGDEGVLQRRLLEAAKPLERRLGRDLGLDRRLDLDGGLWLGLASSARPGLSVRCSRRPQRAQ
jgi:hypothetical protein